MGLCANSRQAQCPAGSVPESPDTSSCVSCPAGMAVVAVAPQGHRQCVQQCRAPLPNARCAVQQQRPGGSVATMFHISTTCSVCQLACISHTMHTLHPRLTFVVGSYECR
jgi:hypothetical protein